MTTFTEALATFERCEFDEIPIPENLKEFVKDKIDAYANYIDYLESESDRYAKLAEKFYAMSKRKGERMVAMETWIKSAMQTYNWKALKGSEREIKLVTQRRFSIIDNDPEKFANQFNVGEVVECEKVEKYKWNKDKLREAYDKDPEAIKPFADFKEITFLRFE